MKTNKKAILGFAVAMVLSLSVMQGMSIKSTKQDVAIQQVAGVAGGIAYTTEGFWGGFSFGVSAFAGTFGGGCAVALVTNLWHPGGWIAAGVTRWKFAITEFFLTIDIHFCLSMVILFLIYCFYRT